MPDALIATTTSRGPGVGSANSASCSLRLPRNVTPRMALARLLRRRFLERVFDRGEGVELDRPRFAAHHLHFADIDVLHDVAGARIDRDWSARAFPFHPLYRADDGIGVGVAVCGFERLVDRVHAVIAADGNEIGAVAGRLLVGGGIVLIEL